MERCWRSLWMWGLLLASFSFKSCHCQDECTDRFKTHPLHDRNDMHVVECTDSGVSLMKIFLSRNMEDWLVSVNREIQTCKVSDAYAACNINEDITARVAVTDLREGETRQYTCKIEKTDENDNRNIFSCDVSVTRPLSTTTEKAVTMPSSSDTKANTNGDSAGHTGSGGDDAVPASLLYVGLVLLILLLAACIVLGVKLYRGWRQTAEANNCDTMKSATTDESFTFSRGGSASRAPPHSPLSTAPPSMAAPDTPDYNPNRVVMQYQRPGDALQGTDASRLFESGVQYQEPWGRSLDDPEILSKMSTMRRPNPHLVKVPDFDAESPEVSSPTQETLIMAE